MNRLRRYWIYLRRINHCKGFGIQSPSDYRFVTEIISECSPYYVYDGLRNDFKPNKELQKICELYLRLANFNQPDVVLDYHPLSNIYSEYIKAGCNKSFIHVVPNKNSYMEFINTIESLSKIDILRMTLDSESRELYEVVLPKVTDQTIFLLEGIHTCKESAIFWNEILNDERAVLTFDLYLVGIICFEKNRYKKNYIINF